MSETISSHIIICDHIDEQAVLMQQKLTGYRVVTFSSDEFKIEDAKKVMAEAYIAEERTKYLLLVAKSFNIVSQNAMLKLLEEPPRNIELILITENKSTLLPTVRSRLNLYKMAQSAKIYQAIDLDFSRLNIAALFTFLKANERLSKSEAKMLIEAMYHKAVHIDGVALNTKQIEAFERSFKLLELNSRLQSVLAALLISFLPKGRR